MNVWYFSSFIAVQRVHTNIDTGTSVILMGSISMKARLGPLLIRNLIDRTVLLFLHGFYRQSAEKRVSVTNPFP